ncbi:MAG: bifunctional enzyme CysN/CysC, partial [Nitriliruptoraceae bacterium]
QQQFETIKKDYESFAAELGATFKTYFLPMSALKGDNAVTKGENLSWFEGPTLMEHLETVDVSADADLTNFRFPVQLVSRPNLDFRGFQGTIASGVVRPGDTVTALPSGVSSTIERIVTFDGDLDVAGPDMAVTLTLTDEIDVSRGDVLVHSGQKMQRAHQVDAMVVWMSATQMRPGTSYLMQSAAGTSNATMPSIRYRLDMDTLEKTDDDAVLDLNDIARCAVSVDRELLFDPYDTNPDTGSFILVDRLTNATVAAGMIVGPSSSWDAQGAETLQHAASLVTPHERATRFAQQPATVLLTGLTGAGKSTIAKALERRLFDSGRVTVRLDGQNVRQGVSRDLGFTAPERSENVRRVAEVARLVNEQGIIAIAAMLAPQASDRERARQVVGADRFIEVYVDTPVNICRDRDPGGLYSALEGGAVIDLPGITSPYEAPTNADLVTSDAEQSADAAADEIVALLRERGLLSGGARETGA